VKLKMGIKYYVFAFLYERNFLILTTVLKKKLDYLKENFSIHFPTGCSFSFPENRPTNVIN
jgi:hypothetical protein